MTIRQRIVLLVVLTFAAIAAIGGYAVVQSRANAAEVRLVTEGVVPSTLASADLMARLKDVQQTVMALVFAPDDNTATQAADTLKAQQAALSQSLQQQQRQASNDTQIKLVQQARQSMANYFGAIEDTRNFKQSGQQEIAAATLFASVAQYQGELEQIVQTLRVEKNRSKDAAIAALNHNLDRTVRTVSGVTLIAAILLSAVGLLLYRQIARPIGQMQTMMTGIAASQDFSQRLPADRKDEIGRSMVAFNAMIEQIQTSSALLRQKTADIQSMLQHMPQGILTVQTGSIIHPEYSAYLSTIFETTDIAGRHVMDVVFSNTNLSADALAQVDAVWGACIDEDAMNFEFNQHLMVGEVEKTMADGRVKVLDLNWSPITDELGNTARMMLCVRDVTELRKLALEASDQRRELEMIGEVLAVRQDKFHDFIIGTLRFVDDNEILIRETAERQIAVVDQLFRNMHTIKGNARTYGLNHLTSVVHEAEQSYDNLRQPQPVIVWDQQQLLAELAAVRAAVTHYARINEVSLGRKGAGQNTPAPDRYVMVDKAQILDTLHRLEHVNTNNLHELIAARDAVRKTLRLLGTETLPHMLSSVTDSLPGLAHELDKAAPLVVFADEGYVMPAHAGYLLKNVFMHLMRNALDHGLEAPDTRLAVGKPATGTLAVGVTVQGGKLHITLEDDGRGLALGKIKEIAAHKGLIAPDTRLNDDETANLVFLPGFSTAQSVTEISGRGVGMDAVRDFIKREHGDIAIRFTDQAEGAPFRQFATVVTLPESFVVQIDAPLARPPERESVPV
ncbi:two-component system chemotaxis sensor kinase CheA [Silvimonas terrae]|uniref:Chemotaxis protein CheA n=1 Tax=Silvimonas terrae TaxID=300266 RepID=A0A840RGJ2_9NEIS|nr:ATP-binding protein [Silvimonas terrae]MBB5192157.1 two-component system chemotaxis sensor kinase CheA [Silvimonas terrae]